MSLVQFAGRDRLETNDLDKKFAGSYEHTETPVPQGPVRTAATEREAINQLLAIAKKPAEHLGNFRDEKMERPAAWVDLHRAPPYIVHVKNVAHSAKEPQLRAAFAHLDPIGLVFHQGGATDGATYGLVEFSTAAAMQSAISLSGMFIGGREVTVAEAIRTTSLSTTRLDEASNQGSKNAGASRESWQSARRQPTLGAASRGVAIAAANFDDWRAGPTPAAPLPLETVSPCPASEPSFPVSPSATPSEAAESGSTTSESTGWRSFTGSSSAPRARNAAAHEAAWRSAADLPKDTPGPHIMYVSNLTTGTGSEALRATFEGTTEARVVESEGRTFGFVHFRTVEGLRRALMRAGETLNGRELCVAIAQSSTRSAAPASRPHSSALSSAARSERAPLARAADSGSWRR
jgi:hypothetical protein